MMPQERGPSARSIFGSHTELRDGHDDTMPDLPRGWRMRNSSVDVQGLPVEEDGFVARSDDEDDVSLPIDIKPDSEGWNDVEDDTEAVHIVCLLCPETFPTAATMMEHCNTAHRFDFVGVQKSQGLDFYGSIKLVNYIRKAVSEGGAVPPTDNKMAWSGDEFLSPFLEDDALLFSLDDLDDGAALEVEDGPDAAASS